MLLGALLWARDIRRRPQTGRRSLRGPWIMGGMGMGVAVFVFYLWLVTHDAVPT